MARRNDHSREELQALALAAARDVLIEQGADGLTTRAVAGRIGYTVGSLYLAFRNRDELVWRLNTQTLERLNIFLSKARRVGRGSRCLGEFARRYVRFAFEHEAQWRLIFEQPLPRPMPLWLKEPIAHMFVLVEEQLWAIRAGRSRASVRKAAHALWGGVHGVCMLGLTHRLDEDMGANSVTSVEILATSLVANYLAGFERAAQSAGSQSR